MNMVRGIQNGFPTLPVMTRHKFKIMFGKAAAIRTFGSVEVEPPLEKSPVSFTAKQMIAVFL